MDWKIKLANIGFTILQDDKPQLYFRQSDVEKFIEQNFEPKQQVSVEPEVKPEIAGIICPFCGENDFDKIGLKYHLENYCEDYNQNQFERFDEQADAEAEGR